ncbi:ribosome small subunit-dependent GTPase A [Pendulispora albinea]|uniref:Small ribosomal subunit biogenesis GTPase RsgA n=1 Tax=Pendulispora albinea TaxID=2741071 RepID=A0ABZ2LND4_9BACT
MHLEYDVSSISHLGWTPFFESQHSQLGERRENVTPARVVLSTRGFLHVVGSQGVKRAVLAGRLRHEAVDESELPVVGDWVGVRSDAGSEPLPVVHVFSRTSALIRKEAGRRTQPQVLVANVNTVLIVSALTAELNVRRIERFVSTVLEGGATPVIVLNKADLCTDPEPLFHAVRKVAGSAQMIISSAATGEGIDSVRALARRGETLALVGASGVGKSAITNCLLESERQRESAVRASDERGRHTTTHRELFVLPGGALLIDTPGLRELSLWTEDPSASPRGFDDVDALAQRCKFHDCTHENEPGCAVQRALSSGRLAEDRFQSWRKLQAEQRWLEARRDGDAARQKKQRERMLCKLQRQMKKG